MINKQEAEKLAEPVVKEIVNCISEKHYADIEKYAQFSDLSLSDFTELIEGFLKINDLPYIDRFEVPCTFKPQYDGYEQLHCGVYNEGRGFFADYDLTTDGELNDLTLNMEFLFTESGGLAAKVLDAHVM